MAEEKKEMLVNDEASSANSSEEVSAPAAKKADKAAKKSKKKASGKKSLGSRIADWFRTYKAEVKKIAWTQPKELSLSTVLVLVCMIVIAAIIALLDFLFNKSLSALTSLVKWFG